MSPRLSISSRDGGRVVHACGNDRAAGHRGTGNGDLEAEVRPITCYIIPIGGAVYEFAVPRLLADHSATCSMRRGVRSGTMP